MMNKYHNVMFYIIYKCDCNKYNFKKQIFYFKYIFSFYTICKCDSYNYCLYV